MRCPRCGCYMDQSDNICDSCGLKLNNNIQYFDDDKRQPSKKKSHFFLSVLFVLITSSIIYTILNLNTSFYFFDTDYIRDTITGSKNDDPDEEKNPDTPKPEPKEEEKPIVYDYNRQVPSQTVIRHDNKYEQVNLTSKNDAIQKIIDDSINQKGSCPSDIVQLEEKIIRDFGLRTINLCEMSPKYALDVYSDLEWLKKNYAEKIKLLDFIAVGNLDSEGMSGTIAYTAPMDFLNIKSSNIQAYPIVFRMLIVLNTGFYFNPSRFDAGIQNSIAQGHFPANASTASPFVHEFGHFLCALAGLKESGLQDLTFINDMDSMQKLEKFVQDWNYNTVAYNIAYEAYNRDLSKGAKSFDAWRRDISSYAMARDSNGKYIYHETIAEAFHDYFNNGNNAKTASKLIVEVLNERL